MKTRQQLELECGRTIKIVLSELEDVAELPPEIAAEPYAFDARRRRVIRTLWGLFKEALNHDPNRTV